MNLHVMSQQQQQHVQFSDEMASPARQPQQQQGQEGQDDVFAGSAAATTEDYVPWGDRDLTPEEQEMWDLMVREEMAKLEGELQEQAMLAQAMNSGVGGLGAEASVYKSNPAAVAPSSSMRQSSSSHQFYPDATIAPEGQRFAPSSTQRTELDSTGGGGSSSTLRSFDKPVTIVQARKTRAPEPLPVPPTFLSAIGSTTRQAASQKQSKQTAFLALVAADEAARAAAKAQSTNEVQSLGPPRHYSSEAERDAIVSAMSAEPYSSRWDTMGTSGANHSAEARQADLNARKRQQQREYALSLEQQQQQTSAIRRQVTTPALAPGPLSVSLSLPAETSQQQSFPSSSSPAPRRAKFVNPEEAAQLNARKGQQQTYHEQLAKQLEHAETLRLMEAASEGGQTYRDNYTAKNYSVRKEAAKLPLDASVFSSSGRVAGGNFGVEASRSLSAPLRRQQQMAEDAEAMGPSFLDNIGSYEQSRSDANLRRQQQQLYNRELAAAASSTAPQAQRVSLRSKYQDIARASEQNSTILGQEGSNSLNANPNANTATSINIGTVLMTAEAAQRKRRQQEEYARQIGEAASRAPLQSPRVALSARGGAAAVGGRQYSVAQGDSSAAPLVAQGGKSLLVSGFSGNGPQTTLALKRAQQEDYKQSLLSDQQRTQQIRSAQSSSDAGYSDARITRPLREPPTNTGLQVGQNIGTSTREAAQHHQRQQYTQALESDKTASEIPKTYVAKARPVSPASPRLTGNDYGYYNTGTSINIGVPTAVNREREREKTRAYQMQLEADLSVAPIVSPRRPSPRRSSQDEDQQQTSLRLQAMDMRTADALRERQRQQARYQELLRESEQEQPVAQSRVPILSLQQNNEQPRAFLLPGDHRAMSAYGQEPLPQAQYEQFLQQHQQQSTAYGGEVGPRSRLTRGGSAEEYAQLRYLEEQQQQLVQQQGGYY